MNHEIAHVNEMIRSKEDRSSLDLTYDVTEIMDTLREKWGLHFDFE